MAAPRLLRAFRSVPARAAAAAAALLVLCAAEPKRQARVVVAPEEVGVELTLLDVEVTDREGAPVRGLEKHDFEVTLDDRRWPVYSVDDLCTCPDGRRTGTTVPLVPPAAEGPHERDPVRFGPYFDFSRLRPDGRRRAVEAAKEWTRKSLPRETEAMVMAYSSDAGLKQPCPFTRNRERLLRAIDAVAVDPKMFDAWAAGLERRMCDCGTWPDPGCASTRPAQQEETARSLLRGAWHGIGTRAAPRADGKGRPPVSANSAQCDRYALTEYQQGRRSFRALQALLDLLDRTPGRQVVPFFFENASLFPSRLFDTRWSAPEHTFFLEMDDAGSSATTSRATVYPAYSGDHLGAGAAIASPAVNFAANLADSTGGRYNRGTTDLAETLDAAARASGCIYRIALSPPARPSRHVYRAVVRARERTIPWRYRVRFESPHDRWLKEVQAVLTSPETAREIQVGVALLPVPVGASGWDLSVQVAVDRRSLVHLPVRGGRQARWEAGALLVREPAAQTWEMFAVSQIHEDKEESEGEPVVHRSEIKDLKPGRYRLAAFVRDRTAGLLGGAAAMIEIPGPRSSPIAGPILVRSPRRLLACPLPPTSDWSAPETRAADVEIGTVPLGGAPIEPGQSLEAHTWICPGRHDAAQTAPVRFVSQDGTPRLRFETAEGVPAGRCLRFVDRISTGGLEPGPYSYHFRWKQSAGEEGPIEARADFEIAPAPNGAE